MVVKGWWKYFAKNIELLYFFNIAIGRRRRYKAKDSWSILHEESWIQVKVYGWGREGIRKGSEWVDGGIFGRDLGDVVGESGVIYF